MRAAACAAAISLAGCATIVAGGPDKFPVRTTPPGAYVYLDGKMIGQTPMSISLDRENSLGDIRIYYPGFQPVNVRRYKSTNWWILGNFFLAMVPVIVDFVTGNWQRFDDDSIDLTLVPGQGEAPYGIQPMPYDPSPGKPTFGSPPAQGPPTKYYPPPQQPPPPQEPRPPQPM